jgi:hypothetical protein
MTREFKKWADKIRDITNGKLVESLKSQDMIIDESFFKKYVDYDEPYNLANIQDFNSLIPTSQRLSKPMFDLEKTDEKWQGFTWEREYGGNKVGAKYDILRVHDVCVKMATSIANMAGLAIRNKPTKTSF